MLSPKKTKFRKQRKHKGKLHLIKGNTQRKQIAFKRAFSGARLVLGSYGLKVLKGCKLTSAQLEACKLAMNRVLKRTTNNNGQLWLRVFPDIPVTKKPAEVRMGKGKGNVDSYVTPIKAGRIIFEFDGITPEQALSLANYGRAKLPIPIKLISSF